MKREIKTHICTGCIGEFGEVELFVVSILDGDMQYSTYYCEKCVKERNFPHGKKIEVGKRLKEPKAPKVKPLKEGSELRRNTKVIKTPKPSVSPKPMKRIK